MMPGSTIAAPWASTSTVSVDPRPIPSWLKLTVSADPGGAFWITNGADRSTSTVSVVGCASTSSVSVDGPAVAPAPSTAQIAPAARTTSATRSSRDGPSRHLGESGDVDEVAPMASSSRPRSRSLAPGVTETVAEDGPVRGVGTGSLGAVAPGAVRGSAGGAGSLVLRRWCIGVSRHRGPRWHRRQGGRELVVAADDRRVSGRRPRSGRGDRRLVVRAARSIGVEPRTVSPVDSIQSGPHSDGGRGRELGAELFG